MTLGKRIEMHILKSVREKDKDQIRSINDRCYKDVVSRQFGRWDEDDQLARFNDKWKNQDLKKIIVNDDTVGFLSVEMNSDHVFFSEILIDPDHQNRGIGTEVLEQVIHDADRVSLPVRLRVLLQSHAISLYKRHGFCETGRTETHILMERIAQQ